MNAWYTELWSVSLGLVTSWTVYWSLLPVSSPVYICVGRNYTYLMVDIRTQTTGYWSSGLCLPSFHSNKWYTLNSQVYIVSHLLIQAHHYCLPILIKYQYVSVSQVDLILTNFSKCNVRDFQLLADQWYVPFEN